MKILAFGASNYSQSINKKLASYIAHQFEENEIEILDLNDYEMPIYGIDRELNEGIPSQAMEFAKKMDEADLIIISLAEYNGSYSVAFKNVLDWVSRVPSRKTFNDKNIFLASTAPGERGGLTVLEVAKITFPYHRGNIVETFSLPFFGSNFDDEIGITDEEKREELAKKIQHIKTHFLK